MTTRAAPAQPASAPPADPTPSAGLTSAEAAQRLRQDGPNALGGEGRRGPLAVLVSQFASPLVLILVAASAVSIAVGDRVEAGIILTIVAMSALLGFVQEARSEAAVAALQARLALRATVIRDGKQQEIPIHDVVRGDIVVLGAGDIVPADARLLEANHLFVDESSLTGESAAVAQEPHAGRARSGQGRGSGRAGLLRDERRQRQWASGGHGHRRPDELRRDCPPAGRTGARDRFPARRPRFRSAHRPGHADPRRRRLRRERGPAATALRRACSSRSPWRSA